MADLKNILTHFLLAGTILGEKQRPIMYCRELTTMYLRT